MEQARSILNNFDITVMNPIDIQSSLFIVAVIATTLFLVWLEKK